MGQYIKHEKKVFIPLVVVDILYAFIFASLAYLLQYIMDAAVAKNGARLKTAVWYGCLLLVGILLITCGRFVLRQLYLRNTARDLRVDIFSGLMKRSIKSFYSQNTAGYISVLNNDVQMIQDNYFDAVNSIIVYSATVIVGVTALITIQPLVALAAVVISLLPLIIPVLFSKNLSALKKDYSNQNDFYNKKAKDFFTGFEVIKSFRVESHVNGSHMNAVGRALNARFRADKFEGIMNAVSYTLSIATSLFAFIVAGVFVINGALTAGLMIAIIQLMNSISDPVYHIVESVNKIKSIRSVWEKINEMMQSDSSDKGSLEVHDLNSRISMTDVGYSFDGLHPVLSGVSLTFDKEKKYAIVGNSGSGKSTLLRLILRYYDNYEGEVRIDGVDSREIATESLYDLCSIIHQNVFLFNDTLRNNITLYNDYGDDEVKQAAHGAGLDEVIEKLPDGLDSRVDENGGNFSGGEKQRVAIARALIKKTPVLILDEATSSLDNETAYRIESSLLDLPGLTCLVVTHRYNRSLLQRYDQIIALKDGRVVETGTFNELMEKKSYFYSLYTVAN